MATPKGGYFNAAGDKLPGVTTVLGRFKDSGGLLYWAHGVGKEQQDVIWKNRIGAWGQMLHKDYAASYFGAPMDKLLSADTRQRIESGTWEPAPESSRLYDVSEKAAAAGTIAHDMIEAQIKGQVYRHPENVEPETLKKAINAFGQYLEWLDNTKITVTETEFGSHSEKHGFGGTLDAMGTDGKGRVVLLDWKTSGAIYPDYIIQLAAYALLLEENRGIKVEGYHIVRVAKESADFAHASFQDLEHEKATFLLMLQLYNAVKQVEKRVKR